MYRTSLFQKKSSRFLEMRGRGNPFTKKRLAGTLMLTSLIDAFSILVVYLLMFFSDTAELNYTSSGIELPSASVIERLDRYFILSIKKEGYFVENKKLELENLTPYLLDLKKKLEKSEMNYNSKEQKQTITIQADKSISYQELSPVIQSCSQVGYSHIKFVVLGE